MRNLLLVFSLFFWSADALAKIKVVATIPDIAEVVAAIGGEMVEIDSLLQGKEDAHYAEARPDYILKVNRADIVCAIGLGLEMGWLPKVLSKSGNAKVQEQGPGFCVLGKTVLPLEVPTGAINRSMGDVHPDGNPHFNLSLLKLIESGNEVVRVLTLAAPEKAADFQKNYHSFKLRLTNLHAELSKKARKKKVMEYHREFTYFFNSYGLESAGSLEEKPGMPPSAARIASVAKLAKENNVAVLFATPSAPHKALERFTEISGIPTVIVPSHISSKNDPKTVEALQIMLLKSIP